MLHLPDRLTAAFSDSTITDIKARSVGKKHHLKQTEVWLWAALPLCGFLCVFEFTYLAKTRLGATRWALTDSLQNTSAFVSVSVS